MFKALFTFAALIATFMGVGVHAATAQAQAGSVASEIATIRQYEHALGAGAFTEDLANVPTSLAFDHTVIVEPDSFAIVTRDSQGNIWVTPNNANSEFLGALTSPIAENGVVGAYGYASDHLVPAINIYVAQNIEEGVSTDPITTALLTYANFEQETGIAAFRDSLTLTSTPAAEVAA